MTSPFYCGFITLDGRNSAVMESPVAREPLSLTGRSYGLDFIHVGFNHPSGINRLWRRP
jgi:hypothetical protein